MQRIDTSGTSAQSTRTEKPSPSVGESERRVPSEGVALGGVSLRAR
ncbi:MAG: hypothetical protein IPN17_32860 [Deltaproteobacteria bacterium]|nr:hypothetical protein [Deltaproteobacteria bacterium]